MLIAITMGAATYTANKYFEHFRFLCPHTIQLYNCFLKVLNMLYSIAYQ